MDIESIKKKNNLYLKKMELTDRLVSLHFQLQKQLDLASLCISKAKTTHGISLFSVNSVDAHDLEPSVRIQTDANGNFELVKEEESEEKDEKELRDTGISKDDDEDEKKDSKHSGESEDVEAEEKKSPYAGQFRPFGVLEPTAAKDARKIIKSAIQTIVELASTQHSIVQKTRELTEI